jgi:hypothetical protein
MVTPLGIVQVFAALELLVGLAIVGLAAQGYRRNQSRAMLFLGGGILTITVVGTALTMIAAFVTSGPIITVVPSVTNLVGMCLILYAIVLARRE